MGMWVVVIVDGEVVFDGCCWVFGVCWVFILMFVYCFSQVIIFLYWQYGDIVVDIVSYQQMFIVWCQGEIYWFGVVGGDLVECGQFVVFFNVLCLYYVFFDFIGGIQCFVIV